MKKAQQNKGKSNNDSKKAVKNGKSTTGELVEVKKETINANHFRKPKHPNSLKMTPQRKRMINESVNALISSNFNKENASKLLGISVQALYARFKRYPQIADQADFYNKQVIKMTKQKIEQFSESSADNVISLATNASSENVRLNANLELLDRAGITPPQQQQTSVQVNVLNAMKKQSADYDI